jgi:hypothetical protein
MHDVMRKRLWRKLESLPDEQIYQVLDFIEFLESKYVQRPPVEASGIQRFAERLEDRMRARDLAPRAMAGTMKLIGTAGRVLDNLAGAGQELLKGVESGFSSLRAERNGDSASQRTPPRPGGDARNGASTPAP